MMKSSFLIIALLTTTLAVSAQTFSGLKGFLKMKGKPVFDKKTPSFFFSQQQDITYWQGSSYINYSENGRIKTTMSFDVQGQLRESFSSINLKKNGALSYVRIQFSPQRTRPVFVYTIH